MCDEFVNLDVREVSDILKKDDIFVDSEETIFEALMRWTLKDPSRQVHLPKLLSYVRMPLLSPQYLADRVAKEECIRSSHACR